MEDAVLNQANPTSGLEYEVLPTTEKVRIKSISISVAWTVQPSPLEVHFTVDGLTRRHYFNNPVTATQYYVERGQTHLDSSSQVMAVTTVQSSRAFLIEAKSLRITAETTGGTVSNITVRIKYAVLRP